MKYPTIKEVEAADIIQLARWYRFLPSPGWDACDLRAGILKVKVDFNNIRIHQELILNRIGVRLDELGGMTPEISKTIGWEKS